jgi:hypothetical protein
VAVFAVGCYNRFLASMRRRFGRRSKAVSTASEDEKEDVYQAGTGKYSRAEDCPADCNVDMGMLEFDEADDGQ